MARKFLVVTRKQAPALQRVLAVLYDLPRKVSHLGVGAVVDANPGDGRRGRCWITRAQHFYRHPANTGAKTDQFAIEVTDELKALWRAKRSVFKPVVLRTIEAQVTSAKALSTAWHTTDPETGTAYLDSSEDVIPDAKRGVIA